MVHSPGEVCTRYALSLALETGEPGQPSAAPQANALEPVPARSQGQFHHYRIACRPDGTLWELGSGAMGVTYKAYDERLKLDVALKVINLAFMNDRGAHSLFLREARAAARVRHSNVASVLFLNDTPGNVFYAMEFVAGEPLSHWLKREGNISPLAAINIARQLASGLAAIHAEGLVHRDLKPGNVLLLPGSMPAAGVPMSPRNAPRVKIIDFGVAREITTDSDAVSTIGFRGTVAYASPEQCEEHFDLDGRSDLYSLGCILFEMLAGHPPFTARSRRAFLNLHVSEPPPIAILAEQPAPLVDVVARLLAKRPEERFEDAQSTMDALDRAQQAIEASGPDVGHTRAPVSSIRSIAGALGNLAKTSRGLPPLPDPPDASRTWLPWVVAGVVAVAATGLGGYFFSRPRANVPAPVAVAVSAPRAATIEAARPPLAPGARRALAVLPFTTSGDLKENSFLADGLRADVLAQLTRIHGLKVISRISPGQFKTGDREDLRKLAQDLGVDTILEGSVRKAGAETKLTVQLVDTSTAENLWVENYDANPATLAAVQSQIALSVAERLNVAVASAEKNALMRPPTGSAAAYQLYMKGQALLSDPAETEKNLDNAAASFAAAIEADPNYALAHAQLSSLHTLYHFWGRDHTDRRLELALNSAETALRLQPDLPESQLAMGNYFYRGFKDYNAALPFYQKAIATMPGNVDALIAIAATDRRQGRWEQAAEKFVEAGELAPLDAILRFNTASTFIYLRQYERAAKILEAGLKQQPDHPALSRLRGELYVLWKGDLDAMRHDVETRPANIPSVDLALFYKVELLLLERRFDDALGLLRTSNFALADGGRTFVTREMLQAEILTQANRTEEARKAWERALPRLAQSSTARPDDARLRLAYAFALAGTGAEKRAIGEATVATQLISFEKDAVDAPFYLHGLALVNARAGNLEVARELRNRLLAVPSQYSKELFRLSSAWNSVRE